MQSKIWLSPPHMSGEEMKYIQDAFDTNWISPVGPNIDGFENDISSLLCAKGAVVLSSGTAAIHLALIILGVSKGDTILCQSFTFSASVNPVTYVGAIPVLIDSEQETWNMDPVLLEEAILDQMKRGKKPKAIILVHLYGMPAKLDEIMQIAEKYEIPVIEDAAEAIGSKYNDKYVGTFGEIGILSFNGNKTITTSGGGAFISDNIEYINQAKFLSTQARDDAPHYQHSEIGYNYRMSNIVAGIGRGQMEVLEERVKTRREINLFYRKMLENINGISFQKEPKDHFSNFWLTTILVDPDKTGGINKEDIRLALEKENIEARPLWKPMHLQPVFQDEPSYVNGTSEKLFELGLCLPSGSSLSMDDKERIVESIYETLGLKRGIRHWKRKEKVVAIPVPFSPPRMDIKTIHSVEQVLRSGWITTGPRTQEFEQKITGYCGNSKTLCVSSATNGLELVLRWFGVGEGDEVILPAYTYCATGNVVLRCNAKPVLVDINHEDFLINVDEVAKKITNRTKVILPVDFAGLPCDYDELNKLVNRKDIRIKFNAKTEIQKRLGRIMILSDAAHSLGAVYKGRKTGVLADITVFSFHAVKNLTTAEGGAIALNLPVPFDNIEVYNYMRIYSLHGQTKDALTKSIERGWKYDVIVPGMKANMTDVLAAIGLVEIGRYETETLSKLKWVFERYDELLSYYPWAELPQYQNPEKTSAFHIYPLRIKSFSESQRDEVIQKCQEAGIMVNVHFQPLPMFSAYSKCGYFIEDVPVSYDSYSCEISLPVFYDITEEQIKAVVSTVGRFVQTVSDKGN